MKYYVIAGEASGDLHGANLIKALRRRAESAEIRAWGGDLMEEAGAEIVKHYRDLAFMGFVEVLMNLRTILGNMKFCRQDIEDWKPDAVILIDYPGFNLRIAEHVKKLGIPVLYYISPQVWAWKQSRVHKIKKVVDRMYVILPFEAEFYARFDYEVDFVGHPLLDALKDQAGEEGRSAFLEKHQLSDQPIVAVLPGSRKQEISVKLPLMLSVMDRYPNHQFVIGQAPSAPDQWYQEVIGDRNVKLVKNDTHALMRYGTAGLVTSGTATLEAALLGLPEVVCYKGNPISYAIARRLIKVKYISLVNLIMDRVVVTELIQHELNTERIAEELDKLLTEGPELSRLKADYVELQEKLGGPGASDRCAELMLERLRQ